MQRYAELASLQSMQRSNAPELPLLAIYSQIGYFLGVGLWAMLWLFQRF